MPLHAPHRPVQARDERERFLVELFDSLWARYRERMEYVRRYEKLVEEHGATFVNDHIAFRTIAGQDPPCGIFSISRIFEALGYEPAACYEFPDKHLSSIHYRHPNPQFPKLFITQLKAWELSVPGQRVLHKYLRRHRPPLKGPVLTALHHFGQVPASGRAKLRKLLSGWFAELPWDVPQKKDVVELDRETQFGAWVLVNGYDVNHFTASVDSHGVAALADIESTVDAMRRAGIPMKKEIEGERGARLRQSSTEAVVLPTPVREGAKKTTVPWTYAYFEIAERPLLKNPATGQPERFEGFLGAQATQLFEMTKLVLRPDNK